MGAILSSTLTRVPATQNALPDAAPLMYFFSTELRKLYMKWAKTEPGVAIADFYSLFTRLMTEPEKYGFNRKYLKEGCIGHSCKDDWREYIWFDDVRPSLGFLSIAWQILTPRPALQYHPTTFVHEMMAEESLKSLDRILWWNSARW